jgi:phosphohistidine phosphatase
MLELVLLRHAHAILAIPNMQDIDRPLSAEGKQQATLQGKQLKKYKFLPQAIITSPALRTLTTAQLVAKVLHYPKEEIEKIPELYLAEVADILQTISEVPVSIQRLLLVGHNPGLSQVCRLIADPMMAELPTAGAVFLQWEASSWDTVVELDVQPIKIISLNLPY